MDNYDYMVIVFMIKVLSALVIASVLILNWIGPTHPRCECGEDLYKRRTTINGQTTTQWMCPQCD